MSFTHFSFNGRLLPIDQATIPVTNIAFCYGFGVYESIRVSKGIIYFLQDHVDRLFHSANVLGIEHPFTKQNVEQYVQELCESIDVETYNLKMLLIGGKSTEDVLLYILPLKPLFPDKRLYRQGATAITTEYERAFPEAKTLNMLQSYLAYAEAKKAGAYDALLIDSEGCIREGTRTNFFTIKDKILYTTPLDLVLEGVTRKAVIHVATKHGFKVQERKITLKDLRKYDGAFVTGTSIKILPLKSIDDFEYPAISDKLKELMKNFRAFMKDCGGILQ